VFESLSNPSTRYPVSSLPPARGTGNWTLLLVWRPAYHSGGIFTLHVVGYTLAEIHVITIIDRREGASSGKSASSLPQPLGCGNCLQNFEEADDERKE
jgi:hypothetical protein